MALDDTLNRLHRTFFDLTVVVDTALRAETPPAIDEILDARQGWEVALA